MSQDPQLFIGLMSGTSADSIDAALVAIDEGRCRIVGSYNCPLPAAMKTRIHDLTLAGNDEITRLAGLDNELGEQFAQATLHLLAFTGTAATKVSAIGSHGQTVRHQAALSGGTRFSLQIANPHIIAERTGILTIADFRRRDIACGGQGAPLAPAFHRAQFADGGKARYIVNIGGMSNITYLSTGGEVTGFDTGPGNTLLDAWVHRTLGQSYDAEGRWAASGEVSEHLLRKMLEHPYLALPPPKSTGREDFNLTWLQTVLEQVPHSIAPAGVQATIAEFTAVTVARAVQQTGTRGDTNAEVFICGGGAHNSHLLRRLQKYLPDKRVDTTAALGLDPDWVEAAAFAWLAKRYLSGEPGNLPAVTGAYKEVVLGAAYPA